MIRMLLFALLFALPAAADDTFMNNTTSESNMCVIDVTGQSQSTPSVVAHANWSPITYNCAAGTYLPADGIECTTCPAGNYCIGGNYTYNETTTQGLTPCAANYTSSAGASVCSPMTYNINYVLNGGSSVPSTYTQLEYLESTGTQYIDTGITDQAMRWTIVAQRVDTTGGEMLVWGLGPSWGQYMSTFRDYRGWNVRERDVYYGHANDKVTVTHEVVGSDANFYVNNTLVDTLIHINRTNSSAYLFGVISGTKFDYPFIGKIFSAKAYKNNAPVRDFIPARRDSDGELGMYDMISGNFFTNDGTGTFVAGPDGGTTVQTYTYGVGTTTNPTTTRAHSTFAGWCTDAGLTNCAATQTIGTTATGDKTFYAKYLCDTGYSTNVSNTACNANTITVNWDNGAGGATQNTCTYGGDLTTPTTAPTKRGHVFTGWTFNLGSGS